MNKSKKNCEHRFRIKLREKDVDVKNETVKELRNIYIPRGIIYCKLADGRYVRRRDFGFREFGVLKRRGRNTERKKELRRRRKKKLLGKIMMDQIWYFGK